MNRRSWILLLGLALLGALTGLTVAFAGARRGPPPFLRLRTGPEAPQATNPTVYLPFSGRGVGLPLSLTLQLASPGPFAADGVDVAEVRVEVRDDQGNLADLPVTAVLFEGDDLKRTLPISRTGPGKHVVLITSTLTGTVRLRVGVVGNPTVARLAVPFEGGPPDHLWAVNYEPPGASGQEVARFEVMRKDPLDNLLPLDPTQLSITSTNPALSITYTHVPTLHLVQVEVRRTGAAPPVGNLWAQGPVFLVDGVSGAAEAISVAFPVLTYTQEISAAGAPPTDTMALTLQYLNFSPLQAYSLTLTFDGSQVTFLGAEDPDPTDPFPVPTVTPLGNGVRIQAQASGPAGRPVVPLTRLQFRPVLSQASLTLGGDLTFLEFGSRTLPTLPLVVKKPKTFCLKFWTVEGTDLNKVKRDIRALKKIFRKARKNCCPAFNFQIKHGTIPKKTSGGNPGWEDHLDHNRDGKLDEFADPKNPTAEEKDLLFHYRDQTCLNIYYVPDMSDGSLGEAFATDVPDTNGVRDCNAVVVNAKSANETTLAHELGHCLGELPDNPSGVPASNLMYQTWRDSHRSGLTKKQCAAIRKLNP